MNKGGSSSATNIDPMALAQAQTQSNIQTAQTQAALNNSNVSAPTGASVWTPYTDPNTGQTRYQLTQALSPGMGNIWSGQVGGMQGLVNQIPWLRDIGTSIAGIGNSIFNNLVPSAAAAVPSQLNLSGVPTAQTLTPSNFQTNVQQGPIQTSVAPGGPIQTSVGGADFNTAIQQAEDAAYSSQTQYLDPQFKEQESNLQQRLADQGITPGTAAYDRAMGDQSRSENFAYQSARTAATQAGQAEQNTLYGQQVSSGQFANQAQAQGFGQAVTAGQFANQAQQQGFGQGLNLADLWNQAVLGATSQNNTAATLGLQRAQATANQPVTALGALTSAAGSTLASGFGGIAEALGLTNTAPTWPTSSIPTMGGYNYPVQPTNYPAASQAATYGAATGNQIFQQNLGNVTSGLNYLTGANNIFSNGNLLSATGPIFGASGLGGLFSSGGAAAGTLGDAAFAPFAVGKM